MEGFHFFQNFTFYLTYWLNWYLLF